MLFTNCSQNPDKSVPKPTETPLQRYLKPPLHMLFEMLLNCLNVSRWEASPDASYRLRSVPKLQRKYRPTNTIRPKSPVVQKPFPTRMTRRSTINFGTDGWMFQSGIPESRVQMQRGNDLELINENA